MSSGNKTSQSLIPWNTGWFNLGSLYWIIVIPNILDSIITHNHQPVEVLSIPYMNPDSRFMIPFCCWKNVASAAQTTSNALSFDCYTTHGKLPETQGCFRSSCRNDLIQSQLYHKYDQLPSGYLSNGGFWLWTSSGMYKWAIFYGVKCIVWTTTQ